MSQENNFIPNQKDYCKLRPFQLFMKHNFPFIENTYESLDIYGLLCEIVKYLNNVIENEQIVTQNQQAVYDAFVELNTYVSNYFDNLDVQEEINNKLDEMVEDGTLINLITAYLDTIAIVKDNITDLKNDTSIVNNQIIKTLEFYKNTNVGGGLYRITNDELTANEMDIIEIQNNLFAVLIDTNEVYDINMYGADNKGVNDSSSIFNYIFRKINDEWLSNYSYKSTISINGTYKINETLTMPTCARLTSSNYSTILSNVDDILIKIDYLSNDLPTYYATDYNWLYGDLIDFKNGCFIDNINNSENVTCIDIGHESNTSKRLTVARYKLKNMTIHNFNIAIKNNAYDNYICYHERISMETNTVGVQLSSGTTTLSNTGENITFTECLFAHNIYAIKYHASYSYDLFFQNCSFDFVTNVFYDVNQIGHMRAFVNNCHLEGFQHLVNHAGNSSCFIFTNSTLTLSARSLSDYSGQTNFQLVYDSLNNSNANSFVILSKNLIDTILPDEKLYNPENYIDFGNMFIIDSNISNLVGYKLPRFYNFNSVRNFDSMETGEISYTSATYFNDWKMNGHSALSLTCNVVQDDYLYSGHKSLAFVRDTAEGQAAVSLISIPIPCKGKIVSLSAFVHNMKGTIQAKYQFYDKNDSLISETDTYVQGSTVMSDFENKWFMNDLQKYAFIPAGADYFKVTIYFQNLNGGTAPIGTTSKIGGIIINQQ